MNSCNRKKRPIEEIHENMHVVTATIKRCFYENDRKISLMYLNHILPIDICPPRLLLIRSVRIDEVGSERDINNKAKAYQREICKEINLKFSDYLKIKNERISLISEHNNKCSSIYKIPTDNIFVNILQFL